MRGMSVVAAALVLAVAGAARGEVSVAKIFGGGMVLQRDMPVKVWGTAAAGEKVAVAFAGQSKEATADGAGKWSVTLDKMPANETGQDLSATGATNTVKFSDVLIGEVWLCGGQSNMEYPLDRKQMRGTSAPPKDVKDVASETLAAVTAKPDNAVRIFRVEKRLDTDLPTDGWHVAAGDDLGKFSAIGYLFGHGLREDLHVPIGLIGSYWGGSRIELWTPRDAYAGTGMDQGGTAATRPGVVDGSPLGKYYDKMVLPMAGYSLRGMIWYQGESNLLDTNNKQYEERFAALAKSWRAAWGEGDFPIGTVQIAPYKYSARKTDPMQHTIENLPELWAIQEKVTQDVKNVGMVETVDLADVLTNIHPWNKWDVASRLDGWARSEVYGEKGIEWSGPVLATADATPDKIVMTFAHGEGLKGDDPKGLAGFEVKGADGKWKETSAKVVDGKVEIDGAGMRGVRYGWREDFRGGMVNATGLPAVPFEKEW